MAPPEGTSGLSVARGVPCSPSAPTLSLYSRVPWPLTQLAAPLVTAGLVAFGLVLAWVPRYMYACLTLFAALSILLLLGACLPSFSRLYPLSLTVLLVSGAAWLAATAGRVDGLWWCGLEETPIRYALTFAPALESLASWFRVNGSHGMFRRTVRRLLILVITGLACTLILASYFSDDLSIDDTVAYLVPLALLAASSQLIALGDAIHRNCLTAASRLAALSLIAVPLLFVSGSVWWSTGRPEPPTPTPIAVAHELREELRSRYPHWKHQSIDLDALWRAYSPRLLDAARDCLPEDEFCRPVFHELRDLFAELNNGHTGIVLPDEFGLPPIDVQRVSDGVAVSWVDADYRDRTCDLVEGSRILAVDGMEVNAAARRVAPWLTAGQRAETREFLSYASLLRGLPGTEVTVSVENRSGESCALVLTRQSELELWLELNSDDYEHQVSSRALDPSLGYLAIDGFGGSGFDKRLHDALDGLMDTSGLILDLRGNGGGRVAMAERFMGRFFTARTRLGDDCHSVCDGIECHIECEERWLDSVDPVYQGSVAVLINERVASAAEVVAYALCRLGNARCFGRTTAGETDFVIHREYSHARVSVSSARFHTSVGQEIQGFGVAPDETVPLSLQDFRRDGDPTLEAARRWFASGVARPGER